jgi:ankyrin repeat protein
MGHDTPLTFETELQWREHMLNPASHPNRKKLPTQAQLDARCPQQQQIAPREQFVCPLCEHIPDEISHKTIKGKLDASRIHSLVVSHVASHIKSLSLMAVPSLETAAIDIDADKESVAFSRDSFRRLLNPESVAHPPSGQEFMEKASLPPQDWSDLHIDDMASHGHISSKVTWDRDFQDYLPPKSPEETSEKEWLIEYKLWRSQHEDLSQADPILDHLRTRQEIEPDVDGQDETGRTKLSFASQAGNEEEVQRLLRLGASVDLVDQDGQSALLWASFSGHDNIVRLLLEHGASFQIADQIFGRTSLSWAASKGNEAVVHRLLDAGDNADALDNSHRTPLSWAASRGHESIVRILLAAYSDCEVKDSRSGRTPLAWAVLKNQPTIVKVLINRGANVDALDKTHRTPLSWAAEEGHTAVVELLIDSGADIESPEPGTLQTPLSLACEEGNADVVEVLLRSRANVAATDSQGWTPLDWALDKGYEEIVKLLVSVGAPSKQLSAA